MSARIEVNTVDELNSLITDGVIAQEFWVNSTLVNRLEGVREIRTGGQADIYFPNLIDVGELESIDCNFTFFGNISSLKNLRFVGGQLRFGAPLKSLGNLKEVKGDLRPTTNDLEDLGKLEKVGGTLDLRGMINLKNLTSLKFVGGNLNLVRSLKTEYDLSGIEVKGRIIYWNKTPRFYQKEILLNNERVPPPLVNLDLYKIEKNIVCLNEDQRDFYEYFKRSFYDSKFVDVGGFKDYVRIFIYELKNRYKKINELESLLEDYKIIKKNYPEYSYDCEKIEIEFGRRLGIPEFIEKKFEYEKYETWLQELKDAIKIQPPLILVDNQAEADFLKIFKIGFKKGFLTEFGNKNLKIVLQTTLQIIRESEKESSLPFARKFQAYGKYFQNTSGNSHFDPKYYKAFFNDREDFQFFLKEHEKRWLNVPEKNKLNPPCFPTIVEFAILKEFSTLMREAENMVREEMCLPRVGEGWISETELFNKIKTAYPREKVVHHGRPRWLGLQHFDIFFPDHNIAIEYQGTQHFEEVEIFGGAEGLAQAQENDRIKREKCEKNNCFLIEVLPGYDFDEVREQIDKAIKNDIKYDS